MHRVVALIAVVLPTLLLPALAAAADFQEGMWEYEIKVDMPGMPAQAPVTKYTQCVTQKDLLPKPPAQHQADCKTVASKVSGNTATWKSQCKKGDMIMEGEGTVTYKSNSMSGTVKNTMSAPGKPGFTTVSNVSGRRIGPCTATK